ncbi:MAG: CtsR family transcriptional regulator [Sulfobacillus thermotolerans]|uniref:Transcriptional regulator n=1 Tax=Sulfobacillus thermotolerans TaxID=338644 RepID=A0ABM6RND4_9FIRM|nr:transcriptional regulator [Sulfobacillus thermotolerans]MCY0907196.1 CtsR family transcriptional regulator [Sulfobacillus thermotolerans]
MASLSDEIEEYLRRLLSQSEAGVIEIQRADIAERFDCVPSQITYVLMTRFTPERGYLVEGRRGGGGGIKVLQLIEGFEDVMLAVQGLESIDQNRAVSVVERLFESGHITERERAMLLAVVRRDVLGVGLPERDRLRARLLQAMLTTLLRPKGAT